MARPSKLESLRQNLEQLGRQPVSRCEAANALAGFGAMIADYIAFGFLDKRRIRARLSDFEGNEILREATRGGRGVILVTANYGLYELGLAPLDALGRRSVVTVAHSSGGPLAAWRRAWRKRWLAETLIVGENPFAALRLLQVLRSGSSVLFLLDDPHGGTVLPFPAPTGDLRLSTVPALLSWLTGCTVVMVMARPLPHGRYRIVTHEPIQAVKGPLCERQNEIERCTEKLGEILLQEIRRAPQFWHALYTGSPEAARTE